MSRLRVIICEVDEENSSRMKELANVDVYDYDAETSPTGKAKSPTAGHQVVHSLAKLASVFYGKSYRGKLNTAHG
jgi:hypothetical protein